MKRFLAGMLAIVLVFASVEPLSNVLAATTSSWWIEENAVQNNTSTLNEEYDGGLSFDTNAYSFYYAKDDKVLDALPATFEATVRLRRSVYRGGTILSNSTYEDSSKTLETTDTFSFGLHQNNRPYLYISDGENAETGYKNGTRYFFKENGDSVYDPQEDSEGNLVPTWVHITIVNDVEAQEMRYYENGQLITTLEDTYYNPVDWSTDAVMAIGSDYRDRVKAQFNGDIKNVAIYSDVRTETEINSDYVAMQEMTYKPTDTDGLMACYALNLDEAYITQHNNDLDLYPRTLTDLSGNGYEMVLLDWLSESEMDAKDLTIDSEDYSYSMAVIGDPQMNTAGAATELTNGTELAKTMVSALFDWVGSNAEELKMKFAFNLGDTTNTDTDTQWEVGKYAVQLLDDYNVPYSIVRGNHDSIAKYNQNFTYDYYKNSLAGSFENNMLNTYQKFTVGDIKYMVLNLDFGIGAADITSGDGSGNYEEVLAWANDVVQANPDYNVIVTTHAYTAPNGEWLVDGDGASATNPDKTGYGRACNGQEIYEQLVDLHSNIVLVISGHVETQHIVHKTRTRSDGSKVVELLVNPQETDYWYDYSGIVTMLYFSEPDTEAGTQKVKAQHYSVLRDKYFLTENQQVEFTLNVIDDTTIVNEDGSVVLSYDLIDTSGKYPVSVSEDYKDYLFAGWYTDATCGTAITDKTKVTESSYAKFWPKDLLDVKVQITNGIVTGETNPATVKYNDNYVIRFVSSLQNLDPAKAGFEVTLKDGTPVGTSTSTKAFKGIESTNAGSKYNFSPKVISELSEWFITAKLPVDPDTDANTDYVVRAYWTTADGTTVSGDSRCVSVTDYNANKEATEVDTINMVINGELTGSNYTASFTSSSDNSAETDDFKVSGATVEVLNAEDGYSNVRITLPAKGDINKMASLTKITIDGTDYYGMYRNYYTSHESGDVSAPHADTSWYYASEDQSKFVIASSADLYGFAALVDSKITFAQKQLVLVRDVEVNKGQAIPSEINADGTIKTKASWKADDGEVIYPWNAIGNNATTNPFAGTFDGDNNTISGLYRDVTTAYNALFTCVSSATIQNVNVTNSYLDSSEDFLSAIVAYTVGDCTLKNIYTDAILVADDDTSICIGGMIGRAATDNSKIVIENCWFDGEINIFGGRYVAGLVGQFFDKAQFTANNCLVTGNIYNTTNTTSGTATGGIMGFDNDKVTATLTNCVVLGNIHIQQNKNVGNIVGIVNKDTSTVTMKDCYAANTIYLQGQRFETATAVSNKTDYNNCMKEANWFTDTALTDMFNDASAWVKDERTATLNQPILKEFAEWIYVYGDK